MRVALTKTRRNLWHAHLDGQEVAHGEESRGEIVWYADEDLPTTFEPALHAEIERLHQYGYTSTAMLDRHLQEGRIRALRN